MLIYNEKYDLSYQLTMAGTLQNVKASYHHNKASKDVQNFHASWDLMEVTTQINLLALVNKITGIEMDSDDKQFQEKEFFTVVEEIFKELFCFSKWLQTEAQGVDVTDEVKRFHLDMLACGLLQLAQKSATQNGDCEVLISFWKNSLSDYHDSKKWKYRIAAHTKIATASGVFGEKIQADSIYNCLINEQGLKNSNIDGDLKVEHVNKMF